ncbi:MAG: DMT family transporter [Bacteroidales bacterium]|nr:DMT family transporter [Bacteroidales bacterium]
MNKEERSYKGHLAMLLANIMWGLNAPIGKTVLMELSPFALTTFRMGGSAFAFWALSAFTPKEKIDKKDRISFLFAALLGVVFNQGLFIFGLSQTSPIDASIVCTTLPIFTMIVAAIYLKEPVTGKKIIGVLFGAAGALILILSASNINSGTGGNMFGNICIFVSQLSVAIYLTVYKHLFVKYSPITISKYMFLYATICFLPFSITDLIKTDFASIDISLWLRICYVVFGATFLAYICMMTGQKSLRPTVVSMYNYIQPIIASSFSIILGLDTFGFTKASAICLVFLGVYIVTQSKSRKDVIIESADK